MNPGSQRGRDLRAAPTSGAAATMTGGHRSRAGLAGVTGRSRRRCAMRLASGDRRGGCRRGGPSRFTRRPVTCADGVDGRLPGPAGPAHRSAVIRSEPLRPATTPPPTVVRRRGSTPAPMCPAPVRRDPGGTSETRPGDTKELEMTTMTTDPHGPAPRAAGDPDAYPVLTVLMLMLGGFVLPVVGWLAGVVMLWTGRAWSTGEKWLGTLVWPAVVVVPGGLVLATGALGGVGNGAPGWLIVAAAVLGVLGVLVLLPWTFVRLLRAGRR
ncbi:hypothetical protein Ae168Ps1_4993 [Pseudonocardia sp. Ae168_Ps1]|nr:hypothetical protein Ae168Ps1_4993 [Pseudonocardia sp. Ae168_Ps1]